MYAVFKYCLRLTNISLFYYVVFYFDCIVIILFLSIEMYYHLKPIQISKFSDRLSVLSMVMGSYMSCQCSR